MEILIAKGGEGEWSCDLWSEGMLMLFNSVFLSSFFFLFLSFENERERERKRVYRVTREQERFWIPCVHRCICILIGFSTSFKVTF